MKSLLVWLLREWLTLEHIFHVKHLQKGMINPAKIGIIRLPIILFILVSWVNVKADLVMNQLQLSCDNVSNVTNPTYELIRNEIYCLAKKYEIPPVIIQSILSKESSWNHYNPDGSVKIRNEPDHRQGIGLMQVTVCPPSIDCIGGYPSTSQEDYDNLKSNWRYNLQRGVEVLNSKWDRQLDFDSSINTTVDKGIIENWYYPVMWFNGEGYAAEQYVADAYYRMENPPPHLESYWDRLTNVANPTGILKMNPPTGKAEGFSIPQLVNEKHVTLHYWDVKTGQYYYLPILTENQYASRTAIWPPDNSTVVAGGQIAVRTEEGITAHESTPEEVTISKCTGGNVIAATSGFIPPLPYSYKNNGGNSYLEYDAKSYKTPVYHPGEDWNVPESPGGSGNGDKGLDVIAVANGLVVYADPNKWGGIVVEHNYQGETWYSQYGHIQSHQVVKGDTVYQGVKIAEIGNVGTKYSHLHFEIRTSNHPSPCNGSYWSKLGDIENVENWYANPAGFIASHPAYNPILLAVNIIDKESGTIDLLAATSLIGKNIILYLNGKQHELTLTSKSTRINLYSIGEINFETLSSPIPIKITSSQGENLLKGCYPFIDVCGNEWYSKSVIKLWKNNRISGYGGEPWIGYFRPNISSKRAEFVSVVVRALDSNVYPTSLAVSPFTDVKGDAWYANYLQYAKQINLITGCDPDNGLFCPNKEIDKAAAITVVTKAFLKDALTEIQMGLFSPSKQFLDVTNPSDWFYPYVYAAQKKQVVHGNRDGYLYPNKSLTRAEMAKIICAATYGASECIESGIDKVQPQNSCSATTLNIRRAATDVCIEPTLPKVTSVSPLTATLGQLLKISVIGENLPETTALWIANCVNVVATGGTAQKRDFECTPSNDQTGSQEGVVKDKSGETVLLSFNVDVSEIVATCTTPTVSSVSPLQVTLDEPATFTVNGSCLTDTTAFWIDACASPNASSIGTLFPIAGGTATQRQYQCTPSYSIGSKQGVVKDQSGGTVLSNFNVNVIAGTPKVTAVSPLTAKLNQSTTFTVTGSNLPDTTAFFIPECANLVNSGGSTTERKFQCTPSYTTGSKSGVVKDKSGGSTLYSFNVAVQ